MAEPPADRLTLLIEEQYTGRGEGSLRGRWVLLGVSPDGERIMGSVNSLRIVRAIEAGAAAESLKVVRR